MAQSKLMQTSTGTMSATVPHAVDRPQHSLSNTGKHTAGTIVIVHPARPWLLPTGSHDARPHDGDRQAGALVRQQTLGERLGEGVRVGPVADHLACHLRAVYDVRVHPLAHFDHSTRISRSFVDLFLDVGLVAVAVRS